MGIKNLNLNRWLLISLMFLITSCQNEKTSSTVKESIKSNQGRNYIDFYYNFFDDSIIVKIDNHKFLEFVANGENSDKGNGVATMIYIDEKWNEVLIELPEHDYSQLIKMRKDKSVKLYWHDKELNSNISKSYIAVEYF